MRFFTAAQTAAALNYPGLISAISEIFASGATAPQRHHHTMQKSGEPDAVLLLMPAWAKGFGVGGVKIVNITPGNSVRSLPAITASYLVFDEVTGEHKAILDGATLTAMRTAAVSALAASHLAKPNSKSLLVVGSGRVANELPFAFGAIRQIEEVLIWSRTPQSAVRQVAQWQTEGIHATAVTDLKDAVARVDIISCATLATEPVIKGSWLKPGQHIDLIGSYAAHMREADDEAMRRAKVFIDTEAALHETGDLISPFASGALTQNSICGTLYDLCRPVEESWRALEDITLFKGVGHALEDLAAARLALSSL